ncbi:hypothetical protein ACMFMF_011919 [Clarireedia jacksonii]
MTSKILSLFRSAKFATTCKSELTAVRCGVVPNLSAVSFIFGSSKNPIKHVDTTLTVRVDSLSSTIRNSVVMMPAFSNNTSIRGSCFAFSQNRMTDWYDERSTSHVSITSGPQWLDPSRRSLAAFAFSSDRQPKMTFEASRERYCFAASNPSPAFAPVMMTVFPCKEVLGCGTVTRNRLFKIRAGKDIIEQ